MKKLNRYVLIACTLLFFLSLTNVAAQVIPITNSSQQAGMAFVVVLPNGDILITYNEGAGFGVDAVIKYTVYSQTKSSWSTAKKTVNTRHSAGYSQLALDKYGIVHMVYMDGTSSQNRDIYYATYDPAADAWTNGELVYDSPGVNSSWCRIKVEDDRIFIVWAHNYDSSVGEMDIVIVVNAIGGSWPVSRRITVSHTGQAVSIHPFFDVLDGKVSCVWMDDSHRFGNWAMYYNEAEYNENTGTWNFPTTPEYLFQTGINQYYPSLTLDDTSTPHIIYSNRNGPFLTSKKVGNSWTAPSEVSRGLCGFTLVAYIIFKQGLLHTAWVESTAGGESLFYGRGLPDGTWAEPVKLYDGEMPGYPCLDVGDDGTVHVVWNEGPFLDDDHWNVKYTAIDLPGNPPAASLVASGSAGLIPFTVNFDASASTDSDGNIIDYRWVFGDGSSAKGAVVSHTYTQKGKYTVLLSVIDNDLRVGTAKSTIIASDGDPIALFDLSAETGMSPFFVTCDASGSVDADGTLVTYDWNFGDGTTATGVTVNHSYQAGGTFTVSLTVTDNDGKTDSTTKTLVVFEKPSASFSVSSDYGTQPLEVTLDASASADPDGEIVSYVWDFGDGLTGLGQTAVHTYSTLGEFLAILTVTDNDGYTGTSTKTVTVAEAPAAPLNVAVEILENKSFLRTEYINRVTWEENPLNVGTFTITTYKIYRKQKGTPVAQYASIGESSVNTLSYDDRQFTSNQDAKNYDYTVTCVDDQGKESAISSTTGIGFINTLLTKIKNRLNF